MKSKKPRMPKKSSPAKPGAPREAAEAFAIIEPELDSVDRLVPINIDIPRAVSIAVGAAPHLMALREQLITQLPNHPVQLLDKLVTYALAAWHAHLLALPVAEENALKSLLEEAAPLREDLLVAAEALAHKKRLDGARVAEIRSGQGHLDIANDLVALAALFSEAWNDIENKTTVEWDDIEHASRLGPELLVALGARNQPGLPVPRAADPADRRARAFTLLVSAYDACRQAVAYLRWNERDAHLIAPSLFTGRGGRKASGARDSDTDGDDGAAQPAEEPGES